MTLCQVALQLGLRRFNLPMELGRIDLFGASARAAEGASRRKLANLIATIGLWAGDFGADGKAKLVRSAARDLRLCELELDGWWIAALQPVAAEWIRSLEEHISETPIFVYEDLPTLYRLFSPADAADRIARLRERTIECHLRIRNYKAALALIEEGPSPNPLQIAACHEGMGMFSEAAAEFLAAGHAADALRCYRSIPDFDKTLEVLAQLPDHPAREPLEWLRRMRDLIEERPTSFRNQILPQEKKLLEQLLENSLGAVRKKPAPKKRPPSRKPGDKKSR